MIDSLPIVMRPGHNKVIGSGFTLAAQVMMASALCCLLARRLCALHVAHLPVPYIPLILIRTTVMTAPKSQFPIRCSEYCRLIFAVLGIERTMIEFVSLAVW
jgi:hypothetical protein